MYLGVSDAFLKTSKNSPTTEYFLVTVFRDWLSYLLMEFDFIFMVRSLQRLISAWALFVCNERSIIVVDAAAVP